jgi:starvation-inducible outer membrane lipoprotein
MPKFSWLLLGFCLALAGCIGGPAISPALQQQAGPPVSFAELAAHPDKYVGQTEVLGGQVMRLEPWHEGTLLTMDQHDLDSHLFPAAAASGGTFLVESAEWLSPGTYQPKSTITIAGVVAGQKNGLLLLKASQVHFWEGPRWEKWYHPVPPEWYGYDPAMEYWYTPPYFSPWMGMGGRP